MTKYKDILDKMMEENVEKVEEEKLDKLEGPLINLSNNSIEHENQRDADREQQLRLDFYRQMNVLEFDNSKEDHKAEDESDSESEEDYLNNPFEELKLAEIRRSVKRPTSSVEESKMLEDATIAA